MSQEAEALRSGPRTPPTLTGREKEEHAQAVVKYAPWLVDLVLKGPMWLSDAYEVAKKWQQQYEEDAAKFGVTVEQWMAFVGAVDVPTPPEGQDADGTETR